MVLETRRPQGATSGSPRTSVRLDAEDRGVVDLGGEDACGLSRRPVAESAAVKVGASDELSHPGSCRERLEVGDPARRFRPLMLDGEHAQRVEAVALDP
jgi:hypothetical protein